VLRQAAKRASDEMPSKIRGARVGGPQAVHPSTPIEVTGAGWFC
jgi:hypothetical protein